MNIAGAIRSRDFWQRVLLPLAALYFMGAGALHFWSTRAFCGIVPPGLPRPDLLVAGSGVGLLLGGAGLLLPASRRAAGWGLIGLLLLMFPANLYMAAADLGFGDQPLPPELAWLRLPLQNVFIFWIWFVSLDDQGARRELLPVE